MKAYSKDLRQRVLADCDGGMEVRQVAVKYRVSESWIRRLRQRRREKGEVAPRTRATAPPKWLPYSERLQQLIAKRPDATLIELKTELGFPFSLPTLYRALQALRFTFKKSPPRGGARPAGRCGKAVALAGVARSTDGHRSATVRVHR